MLKAQCVSHPVTIEQLFEGQVVRRRMAANHLGIILTPFALDLHRRGYACSGIRHHVLVAEHFGQWLKRRRVPVRRLSTLHVQHFLQYHLPRCRCPDPASKRRWRCQAALGRLVEFLRHRKQIREFKRKAPSPGPVDQLVAAFDRYLNDVCGLSQGVVAAGIVKRGIQDREEQGHARRYRGGAILRAAGEVAPQEPNVACLPGVDVCRVKQWTAGYRNENAHWYQATDHWL